jgi:FkbM family methyltransferase
MSGNKYAANTEEAILLDYFASIPSGFFVEVGAYHPFDLSVSWPFERIGWKGILVEPIPEYAEQLRQNRSATVVECACASPTAPNTATLTFDGGFSSMTNGRKHKTEAMSTETITVKCRTLDSVLKENKVKKINLLSIDVEGFEYDVLQGLSLNTYTPDLIFLEDHMHYLHSHSYLTNNGYKLVRRTGVNNWYIPNNFDFDISIFEQLYFFKKTNITPIKNAIKRFFKLV